MGDLELTRLQLLEQRRKDNDQAMWLAPVVLIAAQGFLLKVLSDGGLGSIARLVVLLAGLAATTSACWMLFRGRSRERLYSEAIQAELELLGVADVRPQALLELHPLDPGDGERGLQLLDTRLLRAAGHARGPASHMYWATALLLFAAADIAVFVAA